MTTTQTKEGWKERFDELYVPSQTYADRKEWNRTFLSREIKEAEQRVANGLLKEINQMEETNENVWTGNEVKTKLSEYIRNHYNLNE